MWESAVWGAVAGAALLVGAGIALVVPVPLRLIGLVMGFGAGVLISALSLELTVEAIDVAGLATVTLALLAGAGVYLAGDWAVGNAGGHRRKSPLHGGVHARHHHAVGTAVVPAAGAPAVSGAALVIGALLDGIPESAAIGLGLASGDGVGLAFVAAVFLSNVPESMAASSGLRASGRSTTRILGLWAAVLLASTVAAALGHAVLGDAGPTAYGAMLGFAAGGVLAMVATTMLPEAVEHAGRYVGLVTVLGFAAAVILGEL